MKRIVGITGYAGAGKTSLANILRERNPKKFIVEHLADRLKEEASEFYGISKEAFYSTSKKDKPLSIAVEPQDRISAAMCDSINAYGYFTPRDLLVLYGAFRRVYCPTYWLDVVMGSWADNTDKILLIPDIRYRNEWEYLKSLNGLLIRVAKQGNLRKREDASEQEQELFDEDVSISVPEGVDYLREAVKNLKLDAWIDRVFKERENENKNYGRAHQDSANSQEKN